MEFSRLTETRMRVCALLRFKVMLADSLGLSRYADLAGVSEPERQLITVDANLHGVAHRCKLHDSHVRARQNAHVKQMLPQSAFAADGGNHCPFADGQLLECHHSVFFLLLKMVSVSVSNRLLQPLGFVNRHVERFLDCCCISGGIGVN